MPYVTPPARTDGEVIDMGDWNQDIRTNMQNMPPDVFTAKGDLFVATAADTGTRLAVGSDGQVLKALASEASGLVWGSAGGGDVPLITITSTGPHAVGLELANGMVVAAPASGTWPSANLAILIPFEIPRDVVVAYGWAFNGTAISGNLDIGIYNVSGTRLASTGSTAQSGTQTPQNIALSYTLAANTPYFMALASNDATTQFLRHALTSSPIRAAGCYMGNSSFPLPSTITISGYGSNYLPIFGLAVRTVL